MNIKPIRDVLVCLALAALLAVLVQTALAVHSVNLAVASLPAQLTGIRQDLTSQLSRVVDGDPRSLDIEDKVPLRALLLTFLNGQIRGLRSDTSKQLTAIEFDAMTAIREQGSALNGQVAEALKITNARTGQALDQLAELRADLAPTFKNMTSITAHADEAAAILFRRDALPAQTLGLIAAAKVATGQTALTMRDVQDAMPQMLASFQKIGNNSDKLTAETIATAKESTRLVKNLADNTTPLPKWIRYPAQVVGLLGSAALPVIGIEKLATTSTISSTVVQVVNGKSATAKSKE